MSDDRHEIPEWYIPDGDHVIANEHEREQIEEHGEVKEPLCPHCGDPYIDGGDGGYVHQLVDVNAGDPFESQTLKPGIICTENSTRRKHNGFSARDADTEWLL